MSFRENINRICIQRGTNLTAVVKQVKGSSSFTSAINKGSLPKEDEMVEMAKILHCSVLDFFMDEEDLAPQNEPQNEDEKDILRVYRSLSTKRCKSEHLVFCKTLFRVCYEYRGGRLNAHLLLFCL